MLEGWEIYSHGYSVRFRIAESARQTAKCALQQMLHLGDGRRWKARGERVCFGGSGWLTGRRPSEKTCIGKFNRKYRTVLYNLAVVERDDGLYLDMQGVREQDRTVLLETILGLDAAAYSVAYFRRLEKYVVLSQPEAERFALALGGVPQRGGGRHSRLRWLLRHKTWPVTIRTRAKSVVHGKVYRVAPERGATAAYRFEVWLEGDMRGRTQFLEKDEAVLDDLLSRLVAEHDLHPIERPEVWEGQGGKMPDFSPRDPELRQLFMSGYRGARPEPRKCHPPVHEDPGPRLVLRTVDGEIPPVPCISCPNPPSPSPITLPEGFDPGPSSNGEAVLAQQIADDPTSFLAEVVLDAFHDPTPLVRHLVEHLGDPGAVAVGHISLGDTWYGVEELMEELPPVTNDEASIVLVVEPEVRAALMETTWVDAGGSLNEEALFREVVRWSMGSEQLTSEGLLTHLLRDLRAHCETTGVRIVLVTVDARSFVGLGPFRFSHRRNDTQVRSSLGDDGRYYSHTRYRMERDSIPMLKDERHGRPGRYAWRREAAGIEGL